MTGSEASDRLVVVERLENGALVAQVRTLARQSHRFTADLIVLLAEVDARRLYLGEGFPSLFRFVTGALGFSDYEAYYRIESARIVRTYPQSLPYLTSGRLHLTGLTLVGRAATPETIDELLELCAGRTKGDIELRLAEWAAARMPVAAPVAAATPLFDFAAGEEMSPGAEVNTRAAGSPDAASRAPAAAARVRPSAPSGGTTAGARSPTLKPMPVPMTPRLRSLFERTKALLGHTIPSGDTTEVLVHVLAEFVERTERHRFGAKRPRTRKAEHASGEARSDAAPAADNDGSSAAPAQAITPSVAAPSVAAPSVAAPSVAAPSVAAEARPAPPVERRRHIPARTRRMVFERDEGRCTFVGTGGHRCGSPMRLELHHIVPFALGGPDTPDNLTLHCGPHNRLVAEREGLGVRCVRAER